MTSLSLGRGPGRGSIVVMGVAGCGKTTVASALARRLGWVFVEADALHPPENVEKMRGGTPLDDEDRWPWLDAIAARIEKARAERRPCVVACSALKRRYRERLAGGRGDVCFVYLQGTYDEVLPRLAGRAGHYMPASLLRSQFEALEEPGVDEHAITIPVTAPPEEIVEESIARLGATPA